MSDRDRMRWDPSKPPQRVPPLGEPARRALTRMAEQWQRRAQHDLACRGDADGAVQLEKCAAELLGLLARVPE